jgi:hypothetical protein
MNSGNFGTDEKTKRKLKCKPCASYRWNLKKNQEEENLQLLQ